MDIPKERIPPLTRTQGNVPREVCSNYPRKERTLVVVSEVCVAKKDSTVIHGILHACGNPQGDC